MAFWAFPFLFRRRFKKYVKPHIKKVVKTQAEIDKARAKIRKSPPRFRPFWARMLGRLIAKQRVEMIKAQKGVAKAVAEASIPDTMLKALQAFAKAHNLPYDEDIAKKLVKKALKGPISYRVMLPIPGTRGVRSYNVNRTQMVQISYVDKLYKKGLITPESRVNLSHIIVTGRPPAVPPAVAAIARRIIRRRIRGFVPVPSELSVFADTLTDLYATPPFLEGLGDTELEELLE